MIIYGQAAGLILEGHQTMERLPELNLRIKKQYANMVTLGHEEGKQLDLLFFGFFFTLTITSLFSMFFMGDGKLTEK